MNIKPKVESIFKINESFKHKCAKDVLKSWFEETEYEDYMGIGEIRFRPNRKSGIFLEYPICDRIDSDGTNSWNTNWDEICKRHNPDVPSEYVPSYDECISKNYNVIAIIDMVLTHKGAPEYAIEICHTNPVNDAKLQKLKNFGVHNLLEIDAEWILNQTKRPQKLLFKRLI